LHAYGVNINFTPRAQFDPESGVERPIALRMTPPGDVPRGEAGSTAHLV
jgi:hypothetical protein